MCIEWQRWTLTVATESAFLWELFAFMRVVVVRGSALLCCRHRCSDCVPLSPLHNAGHAQSVRVLSGLRLSWITAAVLDSFRDAS